MSAFDEFNRYNHIKCHSAVEIAEILPHIDTPTKDEIYDIQITIASAASFIVNPDH